MRRIVIFPTAALMVIPETAGSSLVIRNEAFGVKSPVAFRCTRTEEVGNEDLHTDYLR